MGLSAEDLVEIERVGRRCGVCQTGRRWREFSVVRVEGAGAVVMCPACRARFGDAPPVARSAAPAAQAEPAVAPAGESPEPVAESESVAPARGASGKRRSGPREDRLRKALRELPPGEHSVGRIAKAAGLNREKTLSRLQALGAAGEVQQVGKRWSNEPPSTDIEAAMDRLQARTSNLRIVRSREPVG
jgi:hypothetical protein